MTMLIDCAACGRQVSRAAPACPGCGHPVAAGASPVGGNGNTIAKVATVAGAALIAPWIARLLVAVVLVLGIALVLVAR